MPAPNTQKRASALRESDRIDHSARRQLQHWIGRFGDFTSGGAPRPALQHPF